MIKTSKGQIKRNILFGLVGQGALLLMSLVATRLIFKELGAEVLGVISFAVTLTFLLISLSDMGISLVVTREIAAHHGVDRSYVRDLISSVSVLAWAAFFVSCLIVLLAADILVDKWFHFETMRAGDATMALQVISVSLLFAIPRTMYGAIVAGFGRMDVWHIANVWSTGIQQLGMIVVLMAGGGLSQVAIWYAVSAVLGLAPIILAVSRFAGVDALLPVFHRKTITKNLQFGMQMFANSMTSYLVTQADRWVISKYLPLAALGYYGFIQGLVSKGGIVPSAIASAAFPALSSTINNGTNSALISQYNKLQDLNCYLYVPVSAAVAMLGIVVTEFVFNSEVVRELWLPLFFLSVGQYLLGVMSVPYWLAVAMKKSGISLRANLWSLVVVLPILVGLTYKFGLIGAAFSSILYGAWQLVYFVPRFCAQCLGTDAWRWYSRVGAFSLLGVLIYGISWGIAWEMGGGLTTFGLILAYSVGTAFFLVAGWFVAGEDMKNALRPALKGLATRFLRKSVW